MSRKFNLISQISILYDLEPNMFGEIFLISWSILPYDLKPNTYNQNQNIMFSSISIIVEINAKKNGIGDGNWKYLLVFMLDDEEKNS